MFITYPKSGQWLKQFLEYWDFTISEETTALFIIIVESSAFYQALEAGGVCAKLHCILITKSGMPDNATGVCVWQLKTRYNIPIYYFGDSDMR